MTGIIVAVTWPVAGLIAYGMIKGFSRNYYIKSGIRHCATAEVICSAAFVLGYVGLFQVLFCVILFANLFRQMHDIDVWGFCLVMPKELCQRRS